MFDDLSVVIVIFNPEDYSLLSKIESLHISNFNVVIYDNSESYNSVSVAIKKFAIKKSSRIKYLSSNKNIGLSRAYNLSINIAKSSFHAKYCILLDQDSDFNSSIISNLFHSFLDFNDLVQRVAVYSATPIDKSGLPYRNRIISNFDISHNFVKAMSSSFSIINLSVFDFLGGFYDDFFIDLIDIDYCYRARSFGYIIVQNTSICFDHYIGEDTIYFFGNPLFPVSSPFRHYFQIRNTILSFKRNGVSTTKLYRELSKRFVIIFITGFLKFDLFSRLFFSLKGLIHAFTNKTGPMR